MYLFNEGKLELNNEQWQDKSIMLLANDSGQSISISRDFIPWGMTFIEFAEREITTISKQLKEYREVSRKNLEISGMESVLTEFKWNAPQGRMHQMTLLINYPNIVLMLTASCEGEMSEGQKERLSTILTSFQPH
ncbi:DcrB-related protein [Glaesserella sp.]|uniref:DcrB-related protein n=1 Tax=Glaesserella sp. TaxID=2094731 RepID=UPI0035A0B531